jgi:FkbM family methyltransferase
MITKYSNWWTVDYTAKAGDMIRSEKFSCIVPIERSLEHCTQFKRAIDVGTWIGDSTVQLAGLFDEVIGFEAHPEVYDCCVKNLQERNITNVKLHNIALSNEEKQINLYNGKSTFSGWISNKEEAPENIVVHNTTAVQSRTLDSYGFTNIDFIKIDVDSHEGFLLAGAEEFFKNNSPVVMIENKQRVHQDRQPEGMPDAIQLLKDHGYFIKARVAKADYLFLKVEDDTE